ncbi:MAG: hypothetical protein E7355_05165 [Clostridiales bacterium]|nr:hypothetical protein [Clostridiales bacterium]
MENFSVSLPLTGEYLTTVRLTVGGLCSLVGFDVDLAEDYKVCVTESLLILKRNGFVRADLRFSVGEKLSCAVCGKENVGTREDSMEDDISRALLGALLGDVTFTTDENGNVEKIVFEG